MQQKHLTWILVLGVVGITVVGVFVLLALGVLHPVLSVRQPKVIVTPKPQEVSLSITVSPSPTPVTSPTPVPTPPQYPHNAVNLLVNGVPMMALSSRESAERMLTEYLSDCANENVSETEHLIRAYIDAELTTMPADGAVEYLSFEEAKARLLANRTLIPVVSSVEHAEITVGTVETSVSSQPNLPNGTRLIRSFGHVEHTFGLSETLYKSGIAVSASQTLAATRVGSDPMPHAVENGSFAYKNAKPTEAEGPKGKDAGELHFTAPCKGTIAQYYGMYGTRMHYGLDYTLSPGGSVVAPESGTVIFCGERGEYGFVIEIRHADGFISRLSHLDNPSVELGVRVYRGDPIAVLAYQEGDADPHLHYELLIDGIPYNPLQYIQ